MTKIQQKKKITPKISNNNQFMGGEESETRSIPQKSKTSFAFLILDTMRGDQDTQY